MSKYTVFLVNYSLGITVGSVSVTGHSGRRYGYSRYSDKYQAHAIEMTLEEYAKAVQDISRNWHKNRCRWIPYFVESADNVITPQTSPELREIALGHARNLSYDDLAGLMHEKGLTYPPETTVIPPTPISHETAFGCSNTDLPTKFFSLQAIAKKEGVDLTGLKGSEAVKSAILEHRARKAA